MIRSKRTERRCRIILEFVMKNSKTFLIDGVRTPLFVRTWTFKRDRGQAREHAYVQLLNRSGLDAAGVDGVVLGNAFQSGLTPNLARFAG